METVTNIPTTNVRIARQPLPFCEIAKNSPAAQQKDSDDRRVDNQRREDRRIGRRKERPREDEEDELDALQNDQQSPGGSLSLTQRARKDHHEHCPR